jgi:oligopeptidase B
VHGRISHNDGAVNFELASAPVSARGEWTALLPHRDDTRLLSVHAFDTHLVVSFRRDGLTGLRIIRAGRDDHEITFSEPV